MAVRTLGLTEEDQEAGHHHQGDLEPRRDIRSAGVSVDEDWVRTSPAPAPASSASLHPTSRLHLQGETGGAGHHHKVLPGGEGSPLGQVPPPQREHSSLLLPPRARPLPSPAQPPAPSRPADPLGTDGPAPPTELRPPRPVPCSNLLQPAQPGQPEGLPLRDLLPLPSLPLQVTLPGPGGDLGRLPYSPRICFGVCPRPIML